MIPLRLLLVGNLPKPYGGVATYCYYLSRELSKKGIKVYFIDTHTNSKKEIPLHISYFATLLTFTDILQIISKPFIFITTIQALLRFKQYMGFRELARTIKLCAKVIILVKKYDINIIHSQHCLLRTLACVIAGKVTKKPVFMTVMAAEFSHEEIFRRYYGPIIYNTNNVAEIITISQFSKKKMLAKGVQRTIHVIPIGVDTDKFLPLPYLSRKKELRKENILITVAQLSKRKGIDILIKSILYLKKKNVIVKIIGSPGDASDELKILVRNLNMGGKIIFLGQISDRGMIECYNNADIFVLPTKWKTEGFGLVSLEAMACGIPVIASRIGGIPEVVKKGISGILVSPKNPQQLAEAINSLLQNKQELTKIGKSARNWAISQFSWKRVAGATNELYRKYIHVG